MLAARRSSREVQIDALDRSVVSLKDLYATVTEETRERVNRQDARDAKEPGTDIVVKRW